MVWVTFDDKFHSNPKIVSAGLDGAGLYARALTYCGDHLTDGYVPCQWASEVAPKRVRDKLSSTGLWIQNGAYYYIPDYLEFNPSRGEVERRRSEISQVRSKAGKRGAEARWHGKPDGKPDDPSIAKPEQTDGPKPYPLQESSNELSRERDELWDALIAEFGDPLTANERKRLNGVCKQLRGAKATPEQVQAAAKAWRVEFPEAALTDTALAKHWTRLVRHVNNSTPGHRLLEAARQRGHTMEAK